MHLSALVVAWIAVLSDHVSSQTYTFVKECSYLQSTKGQDNAYIIGDKICCFCAKGTAWGGDCVSSRPSTTICNACHWNEDDINDRYYLHYEPHLQKQCFPVDLKNCFPPKIYKKGSITERPKCICPNGRKEVGSHGCEPEPTKPDPSTQETPTQPEEDITHSKSENMDFLDANPSHKPVAPDKTETTTLKKQETHTKVHIDKSVPYGIYIGVPVGVILFIVIIIVIVLNRQHKGQKTEGASDTQGYLQPDSPELGATDSRTGLIPRRTPDRERQNGSNCSDYQMIHESSQAQAKASPQPRPTSRMDTVYSDRDSQQIEPLLDSENVEINQQQSHLQRYQCAEQQDSHVVHFSPEPPQHIHRVSDEPGDQRPTREQVKKNHDIAKNVAEKWGVKLPKKEASAIFRHILSEHDCDNELQDLHEKHSGDTKELYYQLMILAIAKLGHKLTPELLLQRLSSLNSPLQSAIDCVISSQNSFNMTVIDTA